VDEIYVNTRIGANVMLVFFLVFLASCGKKDESKKPRGPCFGITGKIHEVKITKYSMSNKPELRKKSYSPRELTVEVCDQVVWVNQDLKAQFHTATADLKEAQLWFDKIVVRGATSQPVTFKEVGEFTYYCKPHPWMRGKIIVKPRQQTP